MQRVERVQSRSTVLKRRLKIDPIGAWNRIHIGPKNTSQETYPDKETQGSEEQRK